MKGQSSEVLVVESEKIFNEFKMTKEVKKDGEIILKKLNSNLDSLYNQMNFEKNEQIKTALTQRIIEERQKVQDFNDHFISEESTKIWNRINSYTSDYGKEKNCSVIIGSQKNGNVFYIESEHDITSDLLNYINKRYEGTN